MALQPGRTPTRPMPTNRRHCAKMQEWAPAAAEKLWQVFANMLQISIWSLAEQGEGRGPECPDRILG
jgi:hypothetical protein